MEELAPAQRSELYRLLLALQDELKVSLQQGSSSRQIVDLDQPIGRLSRMDALQQQAMAKANSVGLEKRLQLVDSALRAFDSGTYGECRRCEEPIDYQRLKVHPETPFCLDCQKQIEGGR